MRERERGYRSVGEGRNEVYARAGERSKRERERHRGKETTAFLVASQYIVIVGSGGVVFLSTKFPYPIYLAFCRCFSTVEIGEFT